jgi:predicted O-methyltransferase YrrM
MRATWRRLRFGLSTVLGVKRRGFFIPYRYAEGTSPSSYPALRPIFEAAEPRIRETLAAVERQGEGLRRILRGSGLARFDQTWFPRLDGAAAYAILREAKPRLVVEIGSGHSTRFLARAVHDEGLPTRIVCIDPAPRASLDGLGVDRIPNLLQDADPRIFQELDAGDVLFIDSSHIAMPGTDVDRLFLDVLPRLSGGVLVHVHDIVLPDAYPVEWTWRGYNEQLLVGTLLQGGGYEILFSSPYAKSRFPEELESSVLAEIPLPAGAHETSLWLRKR